MLEFWFLSDVLACTWFVLTWRKIRLVPGLPERGCCVRRDVYVMRSSPTFGILVSRVRFQCWRKWLYCFDLVLLLTRFVLLMYIGPCIIVIIEEWKTNVMSQFIKFYLTSSMLNMFRTLIHPSSGACDFFIVSPHWLCLLQHASKQEHTTNVVIQ